MPAIDLSAGGGQPRDNMQVDLYLGDGIHNTFEFQTGVCVLPLAEEPPTSQGELKTYSPVVVLRLHAPYRKRTVRYSQPKQNNPPVIPAPADVGSFVFVGGMLGVRNNLNNTYANFDWDVQSTYVFVENCVSRYQDGFVLGEMPYQYDVAWQNMDQTGAPVPGPNGSLVGAIQNAGVEARVGYNQGIQVGLTGFDQGPGPLSPAVGWGYNTPSYLPGVFFSTAMINGGPAES